MSKYRTRVRSAAPWILGGLSATALALYALGLSFGRQEDFEVYRMGGQHVFGTGLYSSYIPVSSGDLLFTYTPAAAMLFWPISHLSTWAGEAIWDAANIAALAALIAVSSAAVRRRRLANSDWQLALMALAPVSIMLWPVRYGLQLGQIDVLLVLMIVVDLTTVLSWRSKRLPQGVLVGLAAAIKLTPLIFIPFLIATRQWRAAKNAILAFFALTVAMIAIAPASSWSYFTKYAFDVSRIGSATITNNQNLHAALVRAGLSASPPVVDVLLACLCCAGLVLAAIAFRTSSKMLAILLCAATGLLVSPISWQHHYVWCVPVLVWLAFGVDRPTRGPVWAALVAVVFMVIPQPSRLTALGYVLANAYVISALAFVLLTGVMLWARRRSSRRAHHASSALDGAGDRSEYCIREPSDRQADLTPVAHD